jgi:hypothetical protein
VAEGALAKYVFFERALAPVSQMTHWKMAAFARQAALHAERVRKKDHPEGDNCRSRTSQLKTRSHSFEISALGSFVVATRRDAHGRGPIALDIAREITCRERL